MMKVHEGSSHYCWEDLLWNLLDLVVHLEKGGLMTVIAAMTMALRVVVAASAAAAGLLG